MLILSKGMRMKKFIFTIFFIFLLVGCSSKEENTESTVEAETELPTPEIEEESIPKEVKYYEIQLPPERELTELEKELLRYPGIYSGDNYDEDKVNEALDRLPAELTEEEYLEELKFLLLEDYHEELEIFLNFDSTVSVDIERPDETINRPTLKTAHYAILIDASGSMKNINGNKTRMAAAKEAVLEFAEQIPENATISLRVYGHLGSGSNADKNLSCSSTESFYNGQFEQQAFQEALKKVDGNGWTPIALALRSVKEDIPENVDEAIVYVVSDGIETCDGDPVSAAKDLVAADIETVVNIIGFDVDNKGQKLLKEVATAGNGEFTYVDSEQDLKKYMRKQYEELQKAWWEWKEAGKKQAFELKEEKKKLAYETKESMKEKSYQEKERMKKAQQYLRDKYSEDSSHASRRLFSLVVNYGNEKWRYAVNVGNELWRESVRSGNEEWRNFVNEGNEKIKEMREKKNE